MNAFADSRNKRENFDRKMTNAGPVVRLNDVLLALGFRPAPTDADVGEIINACITALSELADRNSQIVERLTVQSKVASEIPLSRALKNRPEAPVEVPDNKGIVSAIKEELAKARRTISEQNQKLRTFENQIRSRNCEIENLRSLLKAQAKDEDRRSALTMTSLREQKIGSNAFLLVNNLQRQIETLEKENESLSRRVVNLNNRGRPVAPSLKEDELRKALCDEIAELKEALRTGELDKEILKFELQESKEKIHLKEVRSVYVLTDPTASEEEELVKHLKHILHSEDVVEEVLRLMKIELEVFPPVEEFIRALYDQFPESSYSEYSFSDIKNELLEKIETILSNRELIGIAGAIAKTLDCNVGESLDKVSAVLLEQKALQDEAYKDPVLLEAMRTLGVSSREKFVPVIRSLEFKLDEFSNFFKRLLAVLNLHRGSTYAACMREIERRLDLPKAIIQSEIPNIEFDDSDISDISTDNLALVREVPRIPSRML